MIRRFKKLADIELEKSSKTPREALRPAHGRMGADGRQPMQDYILEKATLWSPSPAGELPAPASTAPLAPPAKPGSSPPATRPSSSKPAAPAIEKPEPAKAKPKSGLFFGMFDE
mgnify:CR=1 FL=1